MLLIRREHPAPLWQGEHPVANLSPRDIGLIVDALRDYGVACDVRAALADGGSARMLAEEDADNCRTLVARLNPYGIEVRVSCCGLEEGVY